MCRRGLQRSQSLDIRRRPSIKRSEPSSDETDEDFQTKRFRSNCSSTADGVLGGGGSNFGTVFNTYNSNENSYSGFVSVHSD